MSNEAIDEKSFVELYQKLGTARTARYLGVHERSVRKRRRRIEARSDISIPNGYILQRQRRPHREPLTVSNGSVVIGGDAHYWPGATPFMHRAFVMIIRELRERKVLQAVIANGDMLDFAAISRFKIINWEKQPTPKEEIEVSQDRMHEIAEAAGKVPKLWPGGNHDLRFNNYIAANAEKLEGIKGTHLKDFFPLWQPCWSVMINEEAGFLGATMVTHRIKGGVYAIRNNINATCTHCVTNHLHAANVWMETKLPGTLYGVDPGCLAEINSPQFLYLEDNPVSWREGFCVLTYDNGKLRIPELVVRDQNKSDCILWRGESIKVPTHVGKIA